MKKITTVTCAALVSTGILLIASQANAYPSVEKYYCIGKVRKNLCCSKSAEQFCQGHKTEASAPNEII